MQVTRHRSADQSARPGPLGRRTRTRLQFLLAGTATLALAGGGLAYASTDGFGSAQVGSPSARGLMLPSDQAIRPVGDRLLVEHGKLLASTVSPDGSHAAALTNDRNIALTIFDLDGYRVQQKIGTATDADLRIKSDDVGQEGPTYSPDGRFLWMQQKTGFARFPVNPDGTVGAPTYITLPKVGSMQPLPAQAVFSPDGSTLYTALNGQNTVVAMDAASGKVTRTWKVGTAPRGLALVGGKLYVSNEGGRPARPGDATQNSYGTQVPANPTTGSTTTGTVSIIDPHSAGDDVKSLDVGLHPTALHAGNGAVFVTNTNDDSVSVIDSSKEQVTQIIRTRPWEGSKVGYHPNGVTLTKDNHLLVTLGRANAVAVYKYAGPVAPASFVGLMPTDYYPQDVREVGGKVLVTNMRGIGERGPTRTIDKGPGTQPATGHNTHDSTGTLQRFALPSDKAIAKMTRTVFEQNGWDPTSLKQARGRRQAAVPVPKRLGDPSTIKHVFLIVKENRSYDQVFGDDPRGNGDPSLAQFGERATPNQHALARQFGLYDNTYDIGTNSAEGHNWLMQSDDPEYTESSAGEYERSYDTEDDALGHQRSGFLWTGVEAAGHSARNFGEFTQFLDKAPGDWSDYYCDTKQMERTGGEPTLKTDTSSPIPSLNDITVHAYPKFDTDIPDLYRYEIWKRDFDRRGPAQFNMFWLSSDHTGGKPDPIAQVADNDLAVGKMVDRISHSRYWKSSAIFVVEDDTQNGVDHVDGARGPVQIISPWAKHGTVDSRYYTQITMDRTIEQILGMQPMNQKDSAATPMSQAFTSKPDFTPFSAKPNQVSLTQGVTPAPACGEDVPGGSAAAATTRADTVPASMRPVAAQWKAWGSRQHLTGADAAPDRANSAMMDRWTWYRTHDWKRAYPGDRRIFPPSQVPGRFLAQAEND